MIAVAQISTDLLQALVRASTGQVSRNIAGIDYASASAKINLALAEPPQFSAAASTGVAPHHHGTMHIGPSLDYLERAYDDAKYGRPSEEPVLEMTMPTSVVYPGRLASCWIWGLSPAESAVI